MGKVITASVVALLVIGSSAFGQIDLQFQGWNLGVTNNINLSGGPSSAGTTQGVGTLSIQDMGINPDMGGNPTVTATQGIGAALFQDGDATTGGAAVGVVQNLNVAGLGLTVNGQALPAGQSQSIGDLAGPTLQYQGASVNGDQTLTKGVGSNAMADGLNLIGFGMGQDAENNCAEGFQMSIVLGGQYSAIEGAAQAVGTIATTATVQIQQFQTANNPPVVPPVPGD